MKLYDSGKNYRYLGRLIDHINAVIGIIIILLAVMLVIDVEKYLFLFPVLFTTSAVMNILLAYKYLKMNDMLRALILTVAFVALTIISIIGYIVCFG